MENVAEILSTENSLISLVAEGVAGDSLLCSLSGVREGAVCRWVGDGTGAIKKIIKAGTKLPPCI